MSLTNRFYHLSTAVFFVLFINMTTALATDHIYFAGDNIRRANLDGTGLMVLWNFPGVDVAVDPSHGKIFWAVNSGTNTGTIMVANLNGTGAPTGLLTTTWIDQLQIDVANQVIYWDDVGNNRIYRSSITTPSVQMLSLNPAPTTLRTFALDLTNSNLYYLDNGDVYRAGLNGSNTTKLPNNIGDIFFGMAIDPCMGHIFAPGVQNATIPNFPLIIRADLSNAGNEITILQDPTYPDLNVGINPSKIMLDLNNGVMYWVVSSDVGGDSTVRRAYLNGTVVLPASSSPAGPTVIAKGPQSSGSGYFARGLALELANTTCSTATVGVNKDLLNNSTQAVNNIEILLAGTYANINHYDGWPSNAFSSYTETPASGGNTLLTWSAPNNDVQPGQIAHVGFNVPGSSVTILSVSLTHNDTQVGCVQQVSTGTHAWGSSGSQVIYTNNTLGCQKIPRYVGALTVEWHAHQVPLADLNPRTPRKPIRIDTIKRAPILLQPNATAKVDVPQAPPNALFGVIVHKVSGNAKLIGPDVTTDFLEFPVEKKPKSGPAKDSVKSK